MLQVLTVSQTACHVIVTEMEQNQIFVIPIQEFASARSDKSNYFCIHKLCLHISDHFIFNGMVKMILPFRIKCSCRKAPHLTICVQIIMIADTFFFFFFLLTSSVSVLQVVLVFAVSDSATM